MIDRQGNVMAGGCTCGAVRYRLKAQPLFVHCCHCTWCQRESGSAFAVNAFIEASQVELL
ncbi:MAG: GFA family protein, partial [Pseudolabrys sp.]